VTAIMCGVSDKYNWQSLQQAGKKCLNCCLQL